METPLSSIPQLIPNLTSATMVDGSPRAIALDTDLLASVPDTKLRLMCSFGGHIMPRPHDKALTYSSGETRLVVVDRRSSLASLRSRLSTMLLNGRSFTLKYQLPNEDLDSLVTITTDEDFENMIEEYDRTTASATASATQRIRLFLFANKLETAATMGSLLNSAKSETWFVDALNQSGLLPRGLSDSAAVNNTLVNLDEETGGETEVQEPETYVGGENNKRGDDITNDVISHQEMHMSYMPDSPMLEPAGGSSSSSPSTANLPPIHVRATEEQFSQMSFSNVHTQRPLEDGLMENHPMMGYNNAPIDNVTAVRNGQASSDPSMMVEYKKPPLRMQPLVIPLRGAGGYGLASPDSFASDTSISSATSLSKPMYYQEQAPAPAPAPAPAIPKAPITLPETALVQTSHGIPPHENTPVPTTPLILSQSGKYTTMDQQHQLPVQQPLLHQGVQYIPHPSQYIPVYSHQQQNYPVYVMTSVPQPQYVPARTPPLYTSSAPATNPIPEAAQNVYQAVISQNPQVHQIQQQPQHQYMSYSGGPLDTMYFHAQHSASNAIQLVSPYQSMTPAAAAAALADMSKQMTLDNDKEQQQHMAASQPL
ncbi:PB1 domain-containing protein [Hirschfeldia incana]|nr:PB1 domain-containing protein [Hirschfeldia incana]